MALDVTKDFNTGPDGTVCCPDTANDDGLDAIAGTGQPDVAYSNDVTAVKGSFCGKVNTETGDNSAGGVVYHPTSSTGTVWFRVWLRMPTGWIGNATDGTSWKFIGIDIENGSDVLIGHHYLNVYSNGSASTRKIRYTNEPGVNEGDGSSLGTAMDLDQWYLIEMAVGLSATTGFIRIWQDETLIHEAENIDTLGSGTKAVNSQIMFTGSPGSWQQNLHLFIDEIKYTDIEPAGRDAADNPMVGILSGESAGGGGGGIPVPVAVNHLNMQRANEC